MSSNKNKYFVVTQTSIVKAINKTEATKAARQSRNRAVMWNGVDVDRIAADDARVLAEVD